MKKPFMFFTIPFIMGILYYYNININVYILYLVLVCILIIFFLSILLNKNNNIVIIFLFFILGIFVTNIHIRYSVLERFVDENVIVEGKVIKEKDEKETLSKYIIVTDNITLNHNKYKVKEKLLLNIVGEAKLSTGEKIIFKGIINKPRKNTNPKLFNYKLHLLSQRIYNISTIKDYSIIKTEMSEIPWYVKGKLKFIEKVESTFDTYLSLDNSLIMKSIVLGDYSYLDGDVGEKYRDLGLSHLMATSGLHIGIISLVLIRMLSYIGVDRKFSYIITMSVIWIFGYFIDLPPSVIRSNIMFTLLFYSQALAKRYDPINTLFFSMFIILVLNPFWLFDIGFQLSFIVTFSIILLTPSIKNMFYPYENNTLNSLYGILAAQIGSIPIIAYNFNNVSLVSVLANLIIVPILSLCLVLSFFLVLVSLISGIFARSLGVILNSLLSFQNLLTGFLYNMPIVSIKVPSPSFINILLFYIIILILFKIIDIGKLNKEINRVIILYLVLIIIVGTSVYIFDNTLTVNFVDVGQGDCTLVERGNKVFLIDTGGSFFKDSSVAKNILLPYLTKKGIFKIDGVLVSHFHLDHCESLIYLMDHLKIKNIFIGYEDKGNNLYEEIVSKGKDKDIPIIKLLVGNKYYLDKNTYFEVISPDDIILQKEVSNDNNKSMVIALNTNNRKILFTGDIENEVEKYISSKIDFTADFLKVPHHGSNTSSNSIFIDTLKPKYAFIQVGKNNFGHPNEEVLNRYRDRGITVYRNDLHGHITLLIDGNNYLIEPYIVENSSIIEWILINSNIICFDILCSIILYIMMKKYTVVMERLKIIDL